MGLVDVKIGTMIEEIDVLEWLLTSVRSTGKRPWNRSLKSALKS